MKTWKLLLVLCVIFIGIGVGALIGAAVADGGAAAWAAGAVFGVVGLGFAVAVPRVRRDQMIGDGELVRSSGGVIAGPAAGGRWPFEAIAAELSRVLRGTPYVVESNADRIRVRADLADARFLTFGGVRRVRQVMATDIVRKTDGVAITVDTALGLTWTAGVGGTGIPRLSGKASVFTGKSWSWGRRVEWGVGADGTWGRQVDYTFSSAEIKGPVSEVLRRAGWRERWPAEARGAVVIAAVGASSIVIVPLAFLLRALLG